MPTVVSKYIVRKGFDGMAIWPFVFCREKGLKENIVFMNHEKIHLKQQLELLILPFFIWYFVEYLILLIKYRNRRKAYLNIVFEKEAYRNEYELDYLKKRRLFSFLKYYRK